jgi:DNA-directed RNA polymerase
MKTFEETLKDYKRYVLRVASSLNQDKYKEDLIQEGNIGLWDAYNNYDAAVGEFHSFALVYIRGYMLKFLTSNSRTVKVPANKVKEDNLSMSVSLSTPIDNKGSVLSDVIALDEVEDIKDYSMLYKSLNELKPKYKQIIMMHYGLGEDGAEEDTMSFQDIATHFNCSREAIRQQFEKAMVLVRKQNIK